ncbi:MAG TPA: DUF402 domain-containing protein [Longimicrobiales bacterium]|nr:DUF402 domain-containing protein [Longimicrobiales bacterium]
MSPSRSPSDRVRIHYRRLPDREEVFDQRVVLERDDVIVTVTGPLDLPKPLRARSQVLLEPGARAVWFTFPDAWHDIGRFHLQDGTFTGFYANVLTPVEIQPAAVGRPHVWYTTDLFLDVAIPPGGPATLLDEDELDEALALGHVDDELAGTARAEAERLLALAAARAWPPRVAHEWTLERIEAEERSSGR